MENTQAGVSIGGSGASRWRRRTSAHINLLLTLLLAGVISAIVHFADGRLTFVAYLPALAIVVVALSDLWLALGLLLASLFVDQFVWGFHISILLSPAVAASFLIWHRGIRWSDVFSPLTMPLVVYGICILPSFLNAVNPLRSILMLFNAGVFVLVSHVLPAAVRTYRVLGIFLGTYIVLAVMNSLHVFFQAFVGVPRPFGLAGLMFVDMSALAVCVGIAAAIVSRGMRRYLLLCGSLVICLALVLTQTRNTWISASITLALLLIYVFVHPEFAQISRKKLALSVASVSLVVVACIIILLALYPNVAERATDLAEKRKYEITSDGEIHNSLVPRLMIWDTAIRAFLSHPYVGIGVYEFPVSSRYYYRVPKYFFHRYVQGIGVHEGYLAVATETGIIGFLGFIVFLSAGLAIAYRSIAQSITERGRRYALVGMTAMVYVAISLVFTDAWFWGQLAVLWGIIAGLMLANRKLSLHDATVS